MTPAARRYRNLLIRAMTGESEAQGASIAENEIFNALCEQLARGERVAELFLHKGYSKAGDPIDRTAASLPLPIRPR